MKLKAYSILEIMIALMLSGIVISAVYAGYVFTHKQFYKFIGIKTEIRSYFELSEVLNREFETAKKVIKKGSREIEIELIDKKISYAFNNNHILRTLNNQTDTFFFNTAEVEINTTNELIQEPLVDYVLLTFKKDEENNTLSFYKYYGAITLIEE